MRLSDYPDDAAWLWCSGGDVTSVVNWHAGARSSGHINWVKHTRRGYRCGGAERRPGAVTEHNKTHPNDTTQAAATQMFPPECAGGHILYVGELGASTCACAGRHTAICKKGTFSGKSQTKGQIKQKAARRMGPRPSAAVFRATLSRAGALRETNILVLLRIFANTFGLLQQEAVWF